MKRFYIVINTILVIAIIASVVIQPEHDYIATTKISKVVTSDNLKKIVRKVEPRKEVKQEEKKEVKPVIKENAITESVTKIEKDLSSNTVGAAVITNVLEKQTGTMSSYGPDCVGCNGHLATGFDATKSITYQDSKYGTVRIVAGDKKYPFGTIVHIKGSGMDFNAIVLDRGGDIGIGRRFMFDLLCASEAAASSNGTHYNMTFEIMRYGY